MYTSDVRSYPYAPAGGILCPSSRSTSAAHSCDLLPGPQTPLFLRAFAPLREKRKKLVSREGAKTRRITSLRGAQRRGNSVVCSKAGLLRFARNDVSVSITLPSHASMSKIIALVEQRLAAFRCQRIGEAIAEIELSLMPAALPKIAIGLPGKFGL
jgi:hypothetical protein